MLSLAYILYSAMKLRLISQNFPPVYTELTLSMTFLNQDLLKRNLFQQMAVYNTM